MREINLVNESRAMGMPMRAGYCDGFWCLFRGLMLRRSIPNDWGLLLVHPRENRVDSGIHMLFMLFDLGIVWINQSMEVVDTAYAKKWLSMLAPKKPAKYVLEILPERLEDFKVGDTIRFEE